MALCPDCSTVIPCHCHLTPATPIRPSVYAAAPPQQPAASTTQQPQEADGERPRCPRCQLPHDLTPDSMGDRACKSILASLADAARRHDAGDHSRCARVDCEVVQASAEQQPTESAPAVPQCDGCGHLVHRARKCPAVQYGERCECDEPLATDGEARS